MSRIQALVLGVAQDGGMPQVGCDCVNCRGALASGQAHAPAALAVSAWGRDGQRRRVLVDAGPELRAQLRRFGGPVDAVLLTHLHMGHYPGLLEFGREVAGRQGLPVWCSPAVAAVLENNSPWRELATQGHVVYRRFAIGETFTPVAGLEVRPHSVPHRNELGDTVGFVLRPAGREHGGLLYLPDADRWDKLDPSLSELVSGVDVALLDGTFFDAVELRVLTGRDLAEVPHPPVVETIRLLAAHGLANRLALIHLNHTNPLWRPGSEQRRWVEESGARISAEGDRYEFDASVGGEALLGS